MKITQLNLTTDATDLGLKPVRMTRLGSVVVLVGPNGSGKTRLLRAAYKALERWTPDGTKEVSQELTRLQNQLANLQSMPASTSAAQRSLARDLNEAIRARTRELHILSQIDVDTSDRRHKKEHSPLWFMPRASELQPAEQLNDAERQGGYRSVQNGNLSRLPRHTWSYIKVVQDRWFNATHPLVSQSLPNEEAHSATRQYERLVDIIRSLLSTELERDVDGRPTLFGRPSANAGLSDGQAVLLQLAVQLHASNSTHNAPLFIDEPENHLHPAALREFFTRIRSQMSDHQLWIATHSPAVVAMMPSSGVWYVESGSVHHSGATPERVLRGLLGGDDAIDELGGLLSRPAEHATVRFATECLIPPEPVSFLPDDKQTNQMLRHIRADLRLGQQVRVLDVGAGRGRLLDALSERLGPLLAVHVDYRAVEHDPRMVELLNDRLSAEYGDADQRVYSNELELVSGLDPGSVDVVVMCNVLHEITPTEWPRLMRTLHPLVHENGFLLLVEDQRLSVGEMAHPFGFVILNLQGVKALFDWREIDTDLSCDPRGDPENNGRLTAFRIPGRMLGQVTRTTVRNALVRVRENAAHQIRALRTRQESAASFRSGRAHGLWCQLYTNTSLVLAEHWGPSSDGGSQSDS